MEEDVLNYSPIVMFRGTPCIFTFNDVIPVNPDVAVSENKKLGEIVCKIFCTSLGTQRGPGES